MSRCPASALPDESPATDADAELAENSRRSEGQCEAGEETFDIGR